MAMAAVLVLTNDVSRKERGATRTVVGSRLR
jgi:hypothetical protein